MRPNNPPKPAKIPEALYSVCSYFFPRLMFLQSSYGAQIQWGDIAIALQDFPLNCLDLSSAEFWEVWMARWELLGDDYCSKAIQSSIPAGSSRLYRSAAACYHWAEFMYFTDAATKTVLRHKVKDCFRKSLEPCKLPIKFGEFTWNGVSIPYYLILPQSTALNTGALPCVILSNGLDSVTEVEIFAFAEQFLSRGLATFLFDGPGQGINLGCNPIEIRFESVVQEIVGLLHNESSIDKTKLGFFGVSFGGYLALRVAEYIGEYFKCVVNLSGGPNLSTFTLMPRRLKEDFRYAFMGGDTKNMQEIFDRLALKMSKSCRTDILSVHGELDDIFPVNGVRMMDQILGDRHELKVYPTEAHVCLNYISQYSIEIADWVATKLINQ